LVCGVEENVRGLYKRREAQYVWGVVAVVSIPVMMVVSRDKRWEEADVGSRG